MALVQLFILLFIETATKIEILANQRIAEAPSPGEGSFFLKKGAKAPECFWGFELAVG